MSNQKTNQKAQLPRQREFLNMSRNTFLKKIVSTGRRSKTFLKTTSKYGSIV